MRPPAVLPAAALSLCAILAFAAPPALLAEPVPINGFAAKVNDKVITQSELNESVSYTKAAILRRPPSEERAKLLSTLRQETLEGLIERELVLSEFEKSGRQVKPEMVDDDIKSIIREDFENDRAKFLAELKSQGTTIEKFRELRRKMIAVRYMRSTQVNDIPVSTPRRIQEYYDDHPDLFRDQGHIRLRIITMDKTNDAGDAEAQKKLVEEIHRKLKEGADFATVAQTYSIDSAAENGGDRGTISKDDAKGLRADLVQLAFAQKTGVVSEVIQDQSSEGFYYIMKVESRQPGKRAPLSDPKVRNAIEKLILAEERNKALERWLDRLKKTAIIKRY